MSNSINSSPSEENICCSSSISSARNQNRKSNKEKLLKDSNKVADTKKHLKTKLGVESRDCRTNSTKFIVISKAGNKCVATKRISRTEASSLSGQGRVKSKKKCNDSGISNNISVISSSRKNLKSKRRAYNCETDNSLVTATFKPKDSKSNRKTDDSLTDNSFEVPFRHSESESKIQTKNCEADDNLVAVTLTTNNSRSGETTKNCEIDNSLKAPSRQYESITKRRAENCENVSLVAATLRSTDSKSRCNNNSSQTDTCTTSMNLKVELENSSNNECRPNFNDTALRSKSCHVPSDMTRQHEMKALCEWRMNKFLGQSHTPENKKSLHNETSFYARSPVHSCCWKSERSPDTSANDYLSDEYDEINIDYKLIRQCLKHSASPIKKFDILQSIRLRIANQGSLERQKTIQDIVDNDLFEIRCECGTLGLLQNLLWPINIATSHPLQTSTAKLLNTIVSYQIGREYFNKISIVHLLTWSNREIVDETMADNLIAAMMKLSINRFQRFDMIEKGLLKWLGKHMENVENSISTYHLECMTELLRILISVLKPIEFLTYDVLQLVSVLVRYLDKDNASAKLNICRTLRALFQNRKAIKIADNLCSQQMIDDLIKKAYDSNEMEQFPIIYNRGQQLDSTDGKNIPNATSFSKQTNKSHHKPVVKSIDHLEATDDHHTNCSETIENYTSTIKDTSVPSIYKDRGIERRLSSCVRLVATRRKVEQSRKHCNSNLNTRKCFDDRHLHDKRTITNESEMARDLAETLINSLIENVEKYEPITEKENKILETLAKPNETISNKHEKLKKSCHDKCEDVVVEKHSTTLQDVDKTENKTAGMDDHPKISSQQEAVMCEKIISDTNSNSLDAGDKSTSRDVLSLMLSERILNEALNTNATYNQGSSNKKINYSDLVSETNDLNMRNDILENDNFIDELCKKVFHKLQRENMFCGPNCNDCVGINSCRNNEVQNKESA